MNKNKKSSEDIADKAIAKAKAMKEVSEQNVRKQLMESFAPQLKKMISQSILDIEDDDIDLDEEYDDDEMYEEEGDDDEGDDIDAEDLEDLEDALEEGDDDGDGDGDDEDFEVPADPEGEDGEEASDDHEESDEDFLAELKALLEDDDGEEDEDEDDDAEGGGIVDEHSITNMSEGSGDDEDEDEDDAIKETEGKQNGDSYKQDASSGVETKKYEAIVAENRKLKEALQEIDKNLNETVLDEYKTRKFTSVIRGRKLSETAKLKVMRAIDEGKSEKEVNRISSVFETTLPKSSKRNKRISESKVKGGRNSSIRKPKSKKKSINENSSNGNKGFGWANRLADLAGV